MSKVLSAVAWPYANGPRHIGHVAGFGVPSDVFSRYMRMAGHDVLMVSGTDEHGTPILIAADEAGVTPQELADQNHRLIAEDLVALGLSYDLYTRTTTRNHHAVVQELFTGVYDNGYFVEQTTYGAISPSTGRTLPDRYIEGTCPICGYDGARGDQCDNCGNQLDPADLINPRVEDQRRDAGVHRDPALLPRPAGAGRRAEGVARRARGRPGPWRPNVIRFSQNILKDIRPRAMTRDIDWGIPVPLDGWRDNPTKQLYVWFDAVIGYLSALDRVGPPYAATTDAWRQWWNDPEALSYYFMGKDNITFHSQIWPAELLAYSGKGDQGRQAARVRRAQPADRGRLLGVPDDGGQEVLLLEAGRDLRPRPAQPLPARRVPLLRRRRRPGEPGLRLHLAEFVRRTNDELVAGWGNLVNRTANLIAKNFGEIPAAGELTAEDQALLDHVEAAFGAVGDLIGRHRQKAGDRRGDARGRRGQQVRLRLRAVEAQGRRRARAARHGPARGGAVRRRPQPDPLAVPAVLGQRGRRGLRRHRRDRSRCRAIEEVDDLDGGRRLPDHHRRLHRRRPLGAQPDRGRARRSRSRRRSSPSSTRRSSTRSSRGWRAARTPDRASRASRAGPRSAPRPTAPCTRTSTGGRSSATRWPGRSSAPTASEALADAGGPGRRGCGSSSPSGTGSPRTSLAAAVARGTGQVVVLGAGLDTFAYRNPYPARGSSRSTSRPPAPGSGSGSRRPGIDVRTPSATSASTSSATT